MALPVCEITPETLKLSSGTRGTSDGTTAIAISSTSLNCQKVLVQADPDNVPDTFIGHSASSTPIQLLPGQSISVRCVNVQQIFFTTATNLTTVNVNWLAEI